MRLCLLLILSFNYLTPNYALSGPLKKSETTLLSHYKQTAFTSQKTILEHGTDGPQKTLYGNIWSTHSSGMSDGTSTADSAYGMEAL